MAGAIWDKLRGIISNAWNSLLGFFGIGSPSKLAMNAGRMVGQGFIEGLDKMQSNVRDASLRLANAASVGTMALDSRASNRGVKLSPNFAVDVRIGEESINDFIDLRIKEREREIRRRTPTIGGSF